MFWMRNKENIFQYTFLSGGLHIEEIFQDDIQDFGTAKSPELGIVHWLNIFNI